MWLDAYSTLWPTLGRAPLRDGADIVQMNGDPLASRICNLMLGFSGVIYILRMFCASQSRVGKVNLKGSQI